MTEQATGAVTVEATGETVGEAKWKALRELERLTPSLDKAAVRFQVLSEGERGLLGVGYTPARVLASVDADAVGAELPAEAPVDESEAAARVRGVLDARDDRVRHSAAASTSPRTRTASSPRAPATSSGC